MLAWVFSVQPFGTSETIRAKADDSIDSSTAPVEQEASILSEAPPTEWNKTYGGTTDESANQVVQTTDGGFLIFATTNSFGSGGTDVWMIKTDYQGNVLWNRTYGELGDEAAEGELVPTSDGGYAFAGTTREDLSHNPHFWLVKVDGNGEASWSRIYTEGYPHCLVQTGDGGYALAGHNYQYNDIILVKTDSYGNYQWQQGFGSGESTGIIQTEDGGFVLGGYSTGGAFLIKTDISGSQVWRKEYGAYGLAYAFSLVRTSDGGFALAGDTGGDFMLVRTDINGTMLWVESYGGTGYDQCLSMVQTSDGGFALAGMTTSFGNGAQFWLVKTDDVGDHEWNQTYGGPNYDEAHSVIQTTDGSYLLAGQTYSYGAGGTDVWLIKVAPESPVTYDVALTGVDPIQVIANAPALVTDKETAIRIDVTSTSSQDLTIPYINVTYDFGKPYQEKGPNGNGITIKEGTNRIYVPGGPVYQKQGENWIITQNAWAPPEGNDFFFKWTSAGTDGNITTMVELADANSSNNQLTTSKEIVDSKSSFGAFACFKVTPAWWFNYGTPTDTEYAETVSKSRDFVTATYPFSNDRLSMRSYGAFDGNAIPSLGMRISDLPRLWLSAILAGCRYGVGIVSDAYFPYHRESARATGFTIPYMQACIVREEYWTVAAHEIAHSCGLRPFWWTEEYETDPHANTLCDGFWVKERKQITNGVCMMWQNPDPGNTYVHNTDYAAGRPIWICREDFNFLCNVLTLPNYHMSETAGSGGTLLVRGYVCRNGTAGLESLYVLQDVPESGPEPGNCSIRLVDSNGGTLSETPFAISFNVTVDPVGSFETDVAPFAFSLPWQENTSNIQILLNGSTAYERPVTSNIPSVQVTYPDGGENLIAGENCTISWNASDLDGDDLLYTVLYSADGGVNWNPLIIDLNETSYVWDTSHLQKGTDYLLRLIATDGVNTGEDVSNSTFTVKVHDIEATGNAPSKTVIGQGYALSVNATLTNEGDFTETFNATLCANTTAIASQTLTLTSGNSTTITFIWNTSGFARGNYTMSACAWPVPGEVDTEDNNCTDGYILITKVGDFGGGVPPAFFNCDESVDGKDLSLFLQCYKNTAPPEATYLGDLGGGVPPQFYDCDGNVDGKDLALFLQCYKGLGP
jgi:FlaG/FlaF family flagellin (archaellin)/predicted secreted protein